jgi:hypothetical protein
VELDVPETFIQFALVVPWQLADIVIVARLTLHLHKQRNWSAQENIGSMEIESSLHSTFHQDHATVVATAVKEIVAAGC